MTCIIVEDEIPAQNLLKNYLSKLPNMVLKGTFKAAIEAHNFLKNHTIDLVFLDINLPDISGIDFIKNLNHPPLIIMTTAYPEYAVSSFELDTIVDYLVKPFGVERFFKAINKAEQRIDHPVNIQEQTTLFINVDKTLHKIILDDVLFLESDRNYVTIVTKTQKLSFLDSLKNWIEKLPEAKFVQIHKSFIINFKHVTKISGNEIYLDSNRLPIGRTFKQELLTKLNVK